jgi:asparagine synthase (glutamine-hydrolysing)
MCGIPGIFRLRENRVECTLPDEMIRAIAHRGPDASRVFLDSEVGLANARLSIIDVEGGYQPIHNEDISLHLFQRRHP